MGTDALQRLRVTTVLIRVLAGFNKLYYWYSEFANRELAVNIQKTHLGLMKSVNPEVVKSR